MSTNAQLIEFAQAFAHAAHDSIGQRRKYSDDPYWIHTDAVARLVAQSGADTALIVAAHNHDVLEDVAPFNPEFDYAHMVKAIGFLAANYVVELTDVYTKEAYPYWNRAKRKEHEAHRLSQISNGSKTIKLADIVHNSATILREDANFAKVYLLEKAAILPGLVGGDPMLYELALASSPAYEN